MKSQDQLEGANCCNQQLADSSHVTIQNIKKKKLWDLAHPLELGIEAWIPGSQESFIVHFFFFLKSNLS